MIKYFKHEKGVVTQVIGNPREGYSETSHEVIPGMLFDGSVFTTPAPESKSIQQKIDDLENSITKRNYREFVMGNQYSIDKINRVEKEISILRAKL